MNPDPDHRLLVEVARGNKIAVRRLLAAKLPRIVALASRLLGGAVEADDIAQETFMRVWQIAPRWQPGKAQFDTWLYTVALNLCRDRLRRRNRLDVGDVPDQADPSIPVDEKIDVERTAKAVADALQCLPERQREAIVLQYYQDLSNIEAAEVMGVSVEALESLLARGRRRLRELLIEHRS